MFSDLALNVGGQRVFQKQCIGKKRQRVLLSYSSRKSINILLKNHNQELKPSQPVP